MKKYLIAIFLIGACHLMYAENDESEEGTTEAVESPTPSSSKDTATTNDNKEEETFYIVSADISSVSVTPEGEQINRSSLGPSATSISKKTKKLTVTFDMENKSYSTDVSNIPANTTLYLKKKGESYVLESEDGKTSITLGGGNTSAKSFSLAQHQHETFSLAKSPEKKTSTTPE